jgi:hypothetical protein
VKAAAQQYLLGARFRPIGDIQKLCDTAPLNNVGAAERSVSTIEAGTSAAPGRRVRTGLKALQGGPPELQQILDPEPNSPDASVP